METLKFDVDTSQIVRWEGIAVITGQLDQMPILQRIVESHPAENSRKRDAEDRMQILEAQKPKESKFKLKSTKKNAEHTYN